MLKKVWFDGMAELIWGLAAIIRSVLLLPSSSFANFCAWFNVTKLMSLIELTENWQLVEGIMWLTEGH